MIFARPLRFSRCFPTAYVRSTITHDGSMVLLYMVTWIPSIYPSHVSIYIPSFTIIYHHLPSVTIIYHHLPSVYMYAIYIYGNIYHQYTPNVSIYIYIPYIDPMGNWGFLGEPFAAGLKRRSCRASWPSPKRRNPKRQSTRGAVRCGLDTGLYGWIQYGL